MKAKLEKISFEQNHEHIDTQTLMDILIEASQEVAPKRTKRKAKHMNIWNDEIAIALKSNKKALYEWKVNGKPQDGPLKDQKKSTKAKLRGAQRREIALQRNMNMEEIMNAQFRDSKTFYKLVNSYRKRPSVQIEELIVGDETYTTPENILEG